jgi:phosphoglycolate phosphatase-like HAD superfamily hydrolase
MHVFLFDIDGTLLSSGGAGKSAMEAALCQCFGVVLSRQRIPFAGRTDRAIAKDLFALHDVPFAEDTFQRFVVCYLQLLPAHLQRCAGAVLPGIASLLQRLRQRGDVALGLLTGNLQRGAKLKLGHYAIDDYFAFGGFGDVHHDRDEVARESIVAAAAHLGRAPDLERVWVIGDTPLDIRCARAVGARVAAVATGGHSVAELQAAGPDLVFGDLTDASLLLGHLG